MQSAGAVAEFPAVAGASVGDDLRALRKARGLTLSQFSRQIDRSIGWLSQVERGHSEPSIRDLRRIASALSVPISFFFRNADAPAAERGVVVRKANLSALGTRESGLTEELLSPDLSGEFEMIRSVFEAGAESGDVAARPTEEGGHIVSGELELWIGGRHHHLKAGDSFQFHCASYRWRNPGSEPAVAIWIISPPVY